MSDENMNLVMSIVFPITFFGVVASFFFWISSCQRTEIIVACLNNTKDKAACVKEMR